MFKKPTFDFLTFPIDQESGNRLFQRDIDLHELGYWADQRKRQISGMNVYYRRNVHLNPSNICQYRCPLCAFFRESDDPTAYQLSDAEILQEVESAVSVGCTELHWVGGVPENKPYTWYRDTLGGLHDRFPDLKIKAWTAVEILYFAQSSGKTVREVLSELKSLGLSSLPGGGAEIFDPKIRRVIAPKKPTADDWLGVHRIAHELGIPTNATLLFGGIETLEHRVHHLLTLRQLQQESIEQNRLARFDTFVPLVFHPQGTPFSEQRLTSPDDVLRTIAISRLILDNFDHIQAYWVTLGPELAQIALGYGADDFGGTILREKVHHEAGSTTPLGLSVERICQLISETGRIPVEK